MEMLYIMKMIKNVLLGGGTILVLYSMYSGIVFFLISGGLMWLCGLGIPDEEVNHSQQVEGIIHE